MKNLLKNLLLLTLTLCCGTQIFGVLADQEGILELFNAAGKGNIEAAKKIIAQYNININTIKYLELTPLIHFALARKQFDFVKYLIEQENADINILTSNNDDTPLSYAIHSGKLNIIPYLIEKGADINKPRSTGFTPLQNSIYHYLGHNKMGIINPEYIDTIKILLINNGKLIGDQAKRFQKLALQDTILKPIFEEISDYKNDNSKEALVKAINNKSTAFTKHEWLTLALLNGHHKQIQYAIDQSIFTPFEILEGLALRSHMSLDMFNSLWDQLKDDNLEAKLIKVAKENKNKTFLDAVSNYKIKTNVLTGKYTKGKNIFVLPEIAKNITSFEDTSFKL